MIDNAKELYPGVADGLIPEQISYLTLELILKELICRGKNIRDLIHIVEGIEWEICVKKETEIPKIAAAVGKKIQ